MYQARDKVFWFAILSRITVLVLQMVFNAICPDHNADAFRMPIDPTEKHSYLDDIVTFIFGGLTRWDAQYYLHIAKYGYTYENTLAFFPLFPMLMRFVAMVFQVEPPILNYTSTIVISGFVINFVCFVKAALILYDLSELVFKNTKVAYRAAILFCINPASIFFTALYSESMFAYFTFYSILESLNNNPCVFFPLGLSSLVRSNGLINIGFPVYVWIKSMLVTSIPNFMLEFIHYHGNNSSLFFDLRHIFISIAHVFFMFIFSVLPFLYLQMYNYVRFCKLETNDTMLPYHVQQYAVDNNLLILGKTEFPWCNSKIPIAYSYIQDKYWNVGFLRYYQLKQIPNFVLAFPILYLMLKCSIEFFKEHKSKFGTSEFFTGIAKKQKSDNEKYPLEMFVFVVHGLFLTIFCIFFVHIQVSTRLLCSASPLLYWFCALVTMPKSKLSKAIKEIEYDSQENIFSKWKVFFLTQQEYSSVEKIIFGYFSAYVIAGCFMYSNFLPWT
ncbi:hypothetical protein TSAR_001554 [Trichomalopsis sarcophagae]|uniref:GPI mannosyltransferase 2 n=1 Tax=Trichomalopsis sarcophagae TaxID=543379 RepID=A0A232ELC0_9HYME|nr:hypothetical protein TSAR_001554 [Trichomalopsis sarcophagae]